MTDDLPGDLREHIYRTWAATPAAAHKVSHWVMSLEWFNEVRRLDDSQGRSLYQPGMRVSAPEFLLGIPVEIRDDGGVPHLEEL